MLERFLSLLYVKPLQVRMKIAAVATVVSDVIVYGRLTMIVRHLLERNYNLMNRFFPALSIAILTSIFTGPTMF